MWFKKKVVPWALPPLAKLFICLLGSTLRITLRDQSGITRDELEDGALIAFWHNRILMMPYFFQKFCSNRKLTVMMSRSRDGILISEIAGKFGVHAAMGSSSKHGSAAFRELKSILKKGRHDVGITPDGPRGPRYRAQPGIAALAQMTEKPVLPVTCHYDQKWELKSWDRFQIPKPFSKCEILVGQLITPQAEGLTDEIEKQLGT